MKQVEVITLDEALLEKGRGKDLRPRKKRGSIWSERAKDHAHMMGYMDSSDIEAGGGREPRKKKMSTEERLRKLKEWADSEPKYRVKPAYKSMTLDEVYELKKARSHKYIKRLGSAGQYRYVYQEAKRGETPDVGKMVDKYGKIHTGIEYIDKDDGIKKKIVIEQWKSKYPYEHETIKIHAIPVKGSGGRDSENYRKMKLDLHDDWLSDITDTWFDMNHEMGTDKQMKLHRIMKVIKPKDYEGYETSKKGEFPIKKVKQGMRVTLKGKVGTVTFVERGTADVSWDDGSKTLESTSVVFEAISRGVSASKKGEMKYITYKAYNPGDRVKFTSDYDPDGSGAADPLHGVTGVVIRSAKSVSGFGHVYVKLDTPVELYGNGKKLSTHIVSDSGGIQGLVKE